MRLSLKTCAIGAVSALALAACSGGEPETRGAIPTLDADLPASSIVEAAQKEGKVVWYTPIPEFGISDVLVGFEKAYGIKVEVVRFPGNTLIQRYSAEREAGQVLADVMHIPETAFFEDSKDKGWFADLNESEVPALANWPQQFIPDDHYVMVNTQPIGITVNTDEFDPAEVTSWDSLLDKRASTRFAMVDPTNNPYYLAWLRMLEEQYGPEFLESIAAQSPKKLDSAVPAAQQVAAHESVLMAPAAVSGSLALQNEGAPIETVYPEPTVGIEGYVGASADGPHPNAAKLFVNYLLTRAGQEVLNRGYAASPLPDIPDSIPMPEGYTRADTAAAIAEKKRLLGLIGL
ncbi:ABC transporter substrate-binding protein [Rhodococcus opacus]|nr:MULTISPECIES: extracellular solute-binding protein [Rhodococcus]MDI9940135.1 extracellular solute-binding protein [Rhodococcus sp. IEGM 1351]RKM74343.1 transporter [Rhodococcus opacus]UZG55079.1 extracellular solute-binding protein [Rhodococcus opacus]